MLRARIRGIYATALTYIFSNIFKIVQQSLEISQRFNKEIIKEPAEVTIKDS
ncbi:MAG: RNA-binding protein, partial [Sulfolobaceae archaeon]